MATILIYVVLALVALCILMMLGFGLKNAGHRLGGESKVGLAAFALPVVVLVIMYFVTGELDAAFIWATLVVAGLALLSLLAFGIRSLVS